MQEEPGFWSLVLEYMRLLVGSWAGWLGGGLALLLGLVSKWLLRKSVGYKQVFKQTAWIAFPIAFVLANFDVWRDQKAIALGLQEKIVQAKEENADRRAQVQDLRAQLAVLQGANFEFDSVRLWIGGIPAESGRGRIANSFTLEVGLANAGAPSTCTNYRLVFRDKNQNTFGTDQIDIPTAGFPVFNSDGTSLLIRREDSLSNRTARTPVGRNSRELGYLLFASPIYPVDPFTQPNTAYVLECEDIWHKKHMTRRLIGEQAPGNQTALVGLDRPEVPKNYPGMAEVREMYLKQKRRMR